MEKLAGLLEKPLPRPRRDPAGYAAARTLEALLEAIIALEYLERGYTRNAAGKAFQAWRALTGALLALELDRVKERLGSEEEKRWVEEKAVMRIPTSRLKPLSQLLEETGYPNYSFYTSTALALHDYQYNGPDPAAEITPYPTRESAAKDTLLLLKVLTELIETRVKPRLVERGAWRKEHEEALNMLRERLRG